MYIWGFDLGTTSIGFAVVDYDPARAIGRIHRLGVRIFPEGVTEDKKEPRNKTRRAKRLMRRGIRRRKLRRRLLAEALLVAGLLPPHGSPEWQAAMAADTYALRRDGLSRRLEPYEVGRALYLWPNAADLPDVGRRSKRAMTETRLSRARTQRNCKGRCEARHSAPSSRSSRKSAAAITRAA